MVHDAPGRAGPGSGADLSDEAASALEAGRLLFAGPCAFVHAAQSLAGLPPQGLPEVAFAGRSNVGKSSLLNALTGRRALARVSAIPGRTRQLNFFDLGGRLRLVDMPGYGYAEAAKSVKEAWQGMMFDYLRGRASLRRTLLLVDSRVGFKPADRAAMALLDKAACAFQIVLTKADTVKPPALAAMLDRAVAEARAHTAALAAVIVTSSATGLGIPDLRAELASLAR